MQSSYFFLRTSAGFLSLELVLGALLVHEEIGLNTRTFPSGHFCLAVCHRFSAHRLQIRRAARASHGLELSSWERFALCRERKGSRLCTSWKRKEYKTIRLEFFAGAREGIRTCFLGSLPAQLQPIRMWLCSAPMCGLKDDGALLSQHCLRAR